jgi:hypothetical protein
MEGVSKEYTNDGVAAWIQRKGFKISSMNECKGKEKMRIHGLYKIVRKLVGVVFQQKVREQQARKWEKVFLISAKLLPLEKDPKNYEHVDLALYLPRTVREAITRREGTMWYMMTVESKKKNSVTIAKERLVEVVMFAVDQGIPRTILWAAYDAVAFKGCVMLKEVVGDWNTPLKGMDGEIVGVSTAAKGIGGASGTADKSAGKKVTAAIGVPNGRNGRRHCGTRKFTTTLLAVAACQLITAVIEQELVNGS